jgi:hypothetical protein
MLDQNGPNGDDEIPQAAPPDATGIFITLHMAGDIVLWPWGFQGYGDPPNYTQLRTIGRKFAYYNGYDPIGSIWYDVDGATDDWTYGKFGIASFTFEIAAGSGSCAGFFADYGCIDGIDGMPRSFWDENRPTFIYAHKIARTPYMTSYGPDTEGVSVLPNEVPQGTPVDLRATIADHRYEGDLLLTVGAAEYFIDAPGEDGTGIPMTTIDGDWGDLTEEATASVDTTGLGAGQHYILVHGQAMFGQWGPFTAVFFNVFGACDFDSDGGVDLDDYAIFANCLAGPGESTPPDGCSPEQFANTDIDEDLDVDVADFAIFQSCLGGPA